MRTHHTHTFNYITGKLRVRKEKKQTKDRGTPNLGLKLFITQTFGQCDTHTHAGTHAHAHTLPHAEQCYSTERTSIMTLLREVDVILFPKPCVG